MSEDNSDRIIVRKDNLARCKWCGTPESPCWTISQSENLYCTPECKLADESSIKRLSGICFMLLGLISTIPYIVTPFLFPGSAGADNFLIVTGIAFLASGIVFYAESRRGQKYKDRKDKFRGVFPIICSYCSHQNSPHFTACQNCGAPLTKAPFAEESTPPWLGTTGGIVKCPYCAAFNSYRQVKGLQERLVFCQNCSRLFRPSRQVQVVQ